MTHRFAWLMCIGLVTAAWTGLAGAQPELPGAPGQARAALDAYLLAHGQAERAPPALDALSPAVDAALADTVLAFMALERASARGYGGADVALAQAWAEGRAPPPGSLAEAWAAARFDPAAILAARAALLDAALALRDAVEGSGPLPPVHLMAPPALALDTLGLDDTYTLDTALTIDFGGHDTSLNNAGGSNLVNACVDSILGPGVGALIDLAGNDARVSGRGCGINGGGSLGVGFLFDAAGDDTYVSDMIDGNKGVNGGGSVLGLGFLRDLDGHDTYVSGGWGTNGGGWVAGLGLLIDDAGDDAYRVTYDGVNGGGSFGAGLLLDMGGHDLYEEGCPWSCTSAWDTSVVPKEFFGALVDQ